MTLVEAIKAVRTAEADLANATSAAADAESRRDDEIRAGQEALAEKMGYTVRFVGSPRTSHLDLYFEVKSAS